MFLMWISHFRSFDTKTPRSFAKSAKGISVESIVKLLRFDTAHWAVLFPTGNTKHLCGAKFSLWSVKVLLKELRHDWSSTGSEVKIFVSSAKSAKLAFDWSWVISTISFMNNMNKRGPRTLPCGTPLRIDKGDEKELLIRTICVRPVRKFSERERENV